MHRPAGCNRCERAGEQTAVDPWTSILNRQRKNCDTHSCVSHSLAVATLFAPAALLRARSFPARCVRRGLRGVLALQPLTMLRFGSLHGRDGLSRCGCMRFISTLSRLLSSLALP
jgi:hypothetical protein